MASLPSIIYMCLLFEMFPGICTVYMYCVLCTMSCLPQARPMHGVCTHAHNAHNAHTTHYTHYTLHAAQGNCFAIYYHGVTAQHSSYLKTFPVTEMKPHLQLLPYNITCSCYLIPAPGMVSTHIYISIFKSPQILCRNI